MEKTNKEKIKRKANICEYKEEEEYNESKEGEKLEKIYTDAFEKFEEIHEKEDRKSTPNEKYVFEYICSNCNSSVVVIDKKHGEIRCDKCGTIIEEQIISLEKEWRKFDEESSGVPRSGGSIKNSQWDKGLTTKVGIGYTDAYGVPLSTRTKIKQARLRKLQDRMKLVDAKNRNFILVLSKIDRILNTLNARNNIEYMKDECVYIYKKAMEKKLTKGRNHQGMAAAVVYILCKTHKIPFQFLDICKAADVTRQMLWKYIKDMQPVIEEMCSDMINIAIGKKGKNNIHAESMKSIIRSVPEDYLGKFADRWNLPPEIEERAKEILKLGAEKGVLSGRSPAGFAAAALYLAAGEKNISLKISLIKEVKYLTLMNKVNLLKI